MNEMIGFVLNPGSTAGRWLTHLTLYWTEFFSAWLGLLLLSFSLERVCAFVVSWRARKGVSGRRGRKAANAEEAVAELGKHIPSFFMVVRRMRRIAELRYDISGLLPQLAATDAEVVEARLAIPKFAATVPVMFGLLGTLVGLTDAIVRIQPLLAGVTDINDLPQLLSAMTGTLGGMRTAFSASMAGLVSTLVLSALATLVAWMAARALVVIDKAIMRGLVPRVAVTEWQLAATQFSEALARNTEMVDRVSGTMGGWSQQVAEALGKLDQSGDNLRGAAKDIQDSTSAMVGQQREFDGHVAQLAASVQESRVVLAQIQNAISLVQTKSEASMDREAMVNALSGIHSAVAQIVEKVEKVAQGSPQVFGEAVRSIKQEARLDLVNFFDSVEDGFSKRLEEFRASTQHLVATLTANQDAVIKAFGAHAARSAAAGGFERLEPGVMAGRGGPA
jgi:hypothetical protein